MRSSVVKSARSSVVCRGSFASHALYVVLSDSITCCVLLLSSRVVVCDGAVCLSRGCACIVVCSARSVATLDCALLPVMAA